MGHFGINLLINRILITFVYLGYSAHEVISNRWYMTRCTMRPGTGMVAVHPNCGRCRGVRHVRWMMRGEAWQSRLPMPDMWIVHRRCSGARVHAVAMQAIVILKRDRIYVFLLVKLQSRLWGRGGQSVQECCSATYTSYSLYYTHQYSLRTSLYYFQARQPNWRPKKHNNNNKKEKPKQQQKKIKCAATLWLLYTNIQMNTFIYIYIL